MSQEPLFSRAIADQKLNEEREARAREAREQATADEKGRLAARAASALEIIVKPMLTQARVELEKSRIAVDLGNGVDAYGETRLSLTFPSKPRRPTLVFTAIIQSVSPHLGWHLEHDGAPGQALPHRIEDPAESVIHTIIARFISNPGQP